MQQDVLLRNKRIKENTMKSTCEDKSITKEITILEEVALEKMNLKQLKTKDSKLFLNITYKIEEFANLTGYSVNSLQRLDREGKFKAKRTATDKRYYTEEDLELFLTGQITPKEERVPVGYCRVS